jgi:tellurite resistance protein
MIIPIPYGTRYTARVKGSVSKRCRCESCATDYLYTAQREASAQGMSLLWLDNEGAEDRASAGARQQITQKLAKAVDPVACPACGWFQTDMRRLLKRRRLNWMLWVSLPVAFVCLLIGLGGANLDWLIASLSTALCGTVLGLVWFVVHNPNRDHEGPGGRHEKRASKSRGILLASYQRQVYTAHRDILTQAMLLVATADGPINDAEVASIAQIHPLDAGPPLDAEKIRSEAARAPEIRHETHALLAKLRPLLQSEAKQLFVRFGFVVAAADGPINAQEQEAIGFVAQVLQMTASEIRAAVQSMMQPTG